MSLYSAYNTLKQKTNRVYENIIKKQESLQAFYRQLDTITDEIFDKNFSTQEILKYCMKTTIFLQFHTSKRFIMFLSYCMI